MGHILAIAEGILAAMAKNCASYQSRFRLKERD